MTVRRLDATGDIVTSGQQFIDEKIEVSQTITTRLRLFLLEYFRDTSDGTPWFQDILGNRGNLQVKESTIKRRIIQTKGVGALISFDTNFDIKSKSYSISASVLTDFGIIQLNESGLING